MAKKWSIVSTVPQTYVDPTGRIVNGYIVYVNFTQWNESHQVTVKSLDPAVVAEAVNMLYTQREGLDNLGSDK